jgi:hypothetical protein
VKRAADELLWLVLGIALLAAFDGGLSLLPGGRLGPVSLVLVGVGTLAAGLVLIIKWRRLRGVESESFLSSRRSEYALSALWVVTLGGALLVMAVAPKGANGDKILYVAAVIAASAIAASLVLLFVSADGVAGQRSKT